MVESSSHSRLVVIGGYYPSIFLVPTRIVGRVRKGKAMPPKLRNMPMGQLLVWVAAMLALLAGIVVVITTENASPAIPSDTIQRMDVSDHTPNDGQSGILDAPQPKLEVETGSAVAPTIDIQLVANEAASPQMVGDRWIMGPIVCAYQRPSATSPCLAWFGHNDRIVVLGFEGGDPWEGNGRWAIISLNGVQGPLAAVWDGALTATPPPPPTPPSPIPAHLADAFAYMRQCESGGNYGINTGNGYYGAYQFLPSTWRSLGYGGLPHEASAYTQDEAAYRLYVRSGKGQWPVCGRRLP